MWGRGLEGSGMTGVRGDGVSGPGVEGLEPQRAGRPPLLLPDSIGKLACQVNRKTIRR